MNEQINEYVNEQLQVFATYSRPRARPTLLPGQRHVGGDPDEAKSKAVEVLSARCKYGAWVQMLAIDKCYSGAR